MVLRIKHESAACKASCMQSYHTHLSLSLSVSFLPLLLSLVPEWGLTINECSCSNYKKNECINLLTFFLYVFEESQLVVHRDLELNPGPLCANNVI